MSDTPLGERLRTPAAAKYLGIAKSTLEKMRCFGTGPVFERVGRRAVVYNVPALDEYLAQRRATSTSELPPEKPIADRTTTAAPEPAVRSPVAPGLAGRRQPTNKRLVPKNRLGPAGVNAPSGRNPKRRK
jgi:hypothetical protein